MKKFLLIPLLCFLGLTAQASYSYYRVVGQFVYQFDDANSTVQVVDASKYSSDNTYTGEAINYTGAMVIPSSIEYQSDPNNEATKQTYRVVEVNGGAFSGSTITSITIGENVVKIWQNAFNNCQNLQKAIFKDLKQLCTIEFVSKNSNPLTCAHRLYFSDAPNDEVKQLTLEGITSIGQYAFSECWGLTSITIPTTVTKIGIDAFDFTEGVKNSKSFPKTTFASRESLCKTEFKSIKSNPIYFQHDIYTEEQTDAWNAVEIPIQSLRAIVVKEVTYNNALGAYIFAGANKLISISVPKGTNFIGSDAFMGCTALQVAIFDSMNDVQTIVYGNDYANPLRYAANLSVDGQNQSELVFDSDVVDNAFAGSKWLKKVTFNSGVEKIGANAFSSCENLTSITFNEADVKEIGEAAFHSCKGLSSVTLPNSLEKLGKETFRNCQGLKGTIAIPSSCTTLGIGVFTYCTNLSAVIIESAIEEVPELFFSNCYNLGNVELNQSITTIGNNAFLECRALTAIPTLNNLTNIQYSAFKGCTGLTNLVLPDKVVSIGGNAFENCSNIASLTLPLTTETISSEAFSGCTKLTQVFSMKPTIVSASENSFGDSPSAITLYVPSDEAKTIYNAAKPWKEFKEIVVFSTENVELKFYLNDELKDGWTISKRAGSAISEADHPNVEADLDKNSEFFLGWNKEIPQTMPSTNDEFYGYFYTKKEIDGKKYNLYPAEVMKGEGLQNRAVLIAITDEEAEKTEITVSPKVSFNSTDYPVVTIGAKAFEGRNTIQSVVLSTSIKAIESAAFKGCSSLARVMNFPNDIVSVSDSLFWGCSSLTQIHIDGQGSTTNGLPETIKTIGREAFRGCSSFNLGEFPASLTAIGYQAFYGSAIENVVFSASVKLEEETFRDCKSLTKVSFADGFNEPLSKLTFWNCSTLEEVKLGTNVPSINQGAFKGCTKLANITIPASVTFIGNEAFAGCSLLSQITEERPEPPFAAESAFDNANYTTAILYVPEDSYEAYHTANTWKEFTKLTKGAEYELRYVLDGVKDETRTKRLKAGALIEPASTPEKENRKFSGWEGEPKVMPAELVEVTGGFKYAVTYYKDAVADENKIKEEADSFYYNKNIVIPFDVLKNGHETEKFTITFKDAQKVDDEWKDIEVTQDDVATAEIAIPAKDITAIVTYTLSEKEVSYGMVNYKVYLLENRAEVISSPDATGNIEIKDKISVKVSESSEEVEFPVSAIQDNAFYGIQKITGMVLPEGIVSIGKRAFYDNRFTTITIPASVKTIDSEAFRSCTTIQTFNFADGCLVTELPFGVFQGCTSLKNIVLPSKLESIAENGFNNCTQLETVTLPATLTSLGSSAFGGCTALTQIYANPAAAPAANSSNTFPATIYSKATLYVPETSTGYDEQAPWPSFTNRGVMKEYTLTYQYDDKEAQTKQIMVGAKIDLADPVVEGHEFSGWQGLPEVMPAKNVEVTGKFKYKMSYSIDEESEATFALPAEEWIWYGDPIQLSDALSQKEYIYTTTGMPDANVMPARDVNVVVKYIRSEQQYTSDGINYKVVLLKVDGEDAHAEVMKSPDKTGNVVIPDKITYTDGKKYTVTVIQDDAFNQPQNHSRLITGITLPTELKKIGARAFRDCRFTTLTIPASVESIGSQAFLYCTTMAKVTFAGTSLKELSDGAFQSCFSLENIQLPEGLQTIGRSALSNCSKLSALELPKTLTSIGDYAFSGSSNIASVIVKSTPLPQADVSIFETNVYNNAILTVPAGTTVDVAPWTEFDPKNHQEGEESTATEKCKTPTISYDKGTLKFVSETPEAQMIYSISDTDMANNKQSASVNLVKKYNIKVYAKKPGMLWSDEATASITWHNGKPTFEGFKDVTLEDSNLLKGDVNEDGKVSISDAVTVVNIILNDPNAAAAPELEQEEAPEEGEESENDPE